jgi:cytidylate kinase
MLRSIAQKENCIIVGRCADYVLRENKHCIRFFLHAPLSYRIERVMQTEGLSEKDAKAKILKIDRLRAANYRYYTHQIWGYSGGYHLSIDTSYGEAYILEQLEGFVKKVLA